MKSHPFFKEFCSNCKNFGFMMRGYYICQKELHKLSPQQLLELEPDFGAIKLYTKDRNYVATLIDQQVVSINSCIRKGHNFYTQVSSKDNRELFVTVHLT